jgi:hypothetical protein
MAGPQVLSFADVTRMYLRAAGRQSRPVVPVRMPGTQAIRAGALYPEQQTGITLGRRSWQEFLAEELA